MASLIKRVSHMTLIVSDQDKALQFYTKAFGAEVRSDDLFDMGEMKMRWLTIGFPGDELDIAVTPPMTGPDGREPAVGDGNMTVMQVSDLTRLCKAVAEAGGQVVSPPEDLPWGRSAIVRDPDGNPFNLVESPAN